MIDQQRRKEHIQAVREYADWMEANPQIPAPGLSSVTMGATLYPEHHPEGPKPFEYAEAMFSSGRGADITVDDQHSAFKFLEIGFGKDHGYMYGCEFRYRVCSTQVSDFDPPPPPEKLSPYKGAMSELMSAEEFAARVAKQR